MTATMLLCAVLSPVLGFGEPTTDASGGGEVRAAVKSAESEPTGIIETPLQGNAGECAGTARELAWLGSPNPMVWGIAGVRAFPVGERTGPNGAEFSQLFAIDFNFNIWINREHKVYAYSQMDFWGQKPGLGITNSHQGNFDFSKREFDLDVGAAWNYSGQWEARVFGYSSNNLNRGISPTRPAGFNDGVGLENRYYLSANYADLGTRRYDIAKANFLSVGYYPTKEMTDTEGQLFRPGPFVRAYLTYDVIPFWDTYLFCDVSVLGRRDFSPELFNGNVGVAVRPFAASPRFELRLGADNLVDIPSGDSQTSLYFECRYLY